MKLRTLRISVVIVTCDLSSRLEECLRRVRSQMADLDDELVLVVNAAPETVSPRRRDSLRFFADRVEFEPRAGKSHALNRGVDVACGRVLAFTDDDALPRDGWLRSITEPLLRADRASSLVGCGGKVVPVFSAEIPEWYEHLTATYHTHFLGPKHDLGDEPREYGQLPSNRRGAPLGANCAYLRDVLRRNRYLAELGPNRETGLRGGEDFELGFRLLREGYRLAYRPEAIVDHPVRAERMTLSYARRGYFVQGIEKARIDRALGRHESLGKLVRKFLRRRLRLYYHRAGTSTRQVRRLTRLEHISGELGEALRIRYGAAAFPERMTLLALFRFGLRRLCEKGRGRLQRLSGSLRPAQAEISESGKSEVSR